MHSIFERNVRPLVDGMLVGYNASLLVLGSAGTVCNSAVSASSHRATSTALLATGAWLKVASGLRL